MDDESHTACPERILGCPLQNHSRFCTTLLSFVFTEKWLGIDELLYLITELAKCKWQRVYEPKNKDGNEC